MNTLNKINVVAIALVFLVIAGCATSKVTGPSYDGDWAYTFPTQDGGEMDAVMTIVKEGDGFTGSLNSEMGSVSLDNLTIKDNLLEATFQIETYDFDLRGTFDGDLFHGTTGIEGMEFPMEAVRKK